MLEDLVLRRTAELKTANEKLALMGRMTRHDLVNSLSVLSGWLELARESKDEAECKTNLGRAAEALDTMRAALEFAGEYERIGAKSPTWMELRKAFTSSKAGLPVEGIRFIDRLSDTEVYADPMLDKVFRNMVDNSLRHGGKVTTIAISAAVVGGNLTLTYEDDGKGLSDEDRQHLFEPGHGRHTGLGMYFARKVLEMTGISIEERGVRGSGAKFVITVPAAGFRPMTRTASDVVHG
jgi:signal transduction histidine kinase